VGFGRAVPLWLDEGVAQWAERGRRPETEALVRRLDTRGELLPLAALARLNVREAADPLVAARFYGQAASVVGYLIVAHGAGRFRKLCGHLRAGKSIDDALRFTYPSTARNMVTLEQQWKAHLREAR
jgi:hypothetical protein